MKLEGTVEELIAILSASATARQNEVASDHLSESLINSERECSELEADVADLKLALQHAEFERGAAFTDLANERRISETMRDEIARLKNIIKGERAMSNHRPIQSLSKIGAIKLVRQVSGMELKDAKEYVEKNCDEFKAAPVFHD